MPAPISELNIVTSEDETAVGTPASDQPVGSIRDPRSLASTALVIGVGTVLLSLVLGVLAYRYSRSALLEFVTKQNLAASQSIVNEAKLLLEQMPGGGDGQDPVQVVERIWQRAVPLVEGSYLSLADGRTQTAASCIPFRMVVYEVPRGLLTC